jgi:membrane protein
VLAFLGILATMVLWQICSFTFGHYLAEFAYRYVNYYARLASAMIALVFLYYSAWIFVYGGELNAAIARARGEGVVRAIASFGTGRFGPAA